MKIIRNIQLAVFFIMFGPMCFSQQDAIFTHYMYNTLSVNPAYAGSRDVLSVTELSRIQWFGIEGAPISSNITIHSPFWDGNSGIGGSFINDRIGPVIFNSLYLDYSYKVKVSKKANLAFGINAGTSIMQNTLRELVIIEPNDVSFETPVLSKVLPNFGVGLYYSTPKMYFGISSPKLIENHYFDYKIQNNSKEQRHYFITTGATVKLSKDFDWAPAIFCRATNAVPIESDITNMFVYQKKFHGGLMYRSSNAAGIILGMEIYKQFLFSYAFDWSYGLRSYSNSTGSHEIVLRYERTQYKKSHPSKMFR